MPLGGGGAKPEARNRGAKPRREMKSNGSCVLWLIATLTVDDDRTEVDTEPFGFRE